MKKVRVFIGVALLAVAAVLAYFHFFAKGKIDEEIKKALASLPAGWSVEYKALDYAPSSDLLIIEGVTLTAPSTPPVTVRFDKLEVGGVTVSTINELIKGEGKITEFVPLAKSFVLSNLSIEQPDNFTFLTKQYEASGISVRPWARMSGPLTTEQIVTLLRSYRIESETLSDTKTSISLFKDMMPFQTDIAKVAAIKSGEGKSERLEITGMTMAGEVPSDIPGKKIIKVKVGIGSTVANKLDFNELLPALAEGNLRRYAAKGMMYDSVLYKDITYDIEGLMSVAAKEVSVTDTAFEKGIPTKAHFAMSGMTVVPQEGDAKKIWEDLGYKAPPAFNGKGNYVYNVADKRMELNDFQIAADDVASLTVTFKLVGLDPYALNEAVMKSPEDADKITQQAMENMDLAALNIRFEDKSIVGRIYEAAGAQNGQSGEEVQQEAMMGVAFLGGMLAKDAPELAAIFESIVQFLENPKSINLTLAPAQPIPLGERGEAFFAGKEPGEILKLLGLSLSVNN